MKLHLPCKLLAAVLICLGIAAPSTLGADSISINFARGQDGALSEISEGRSAGLLPVDEQYWKQVTGISSSAPEALTVYTGTEAASTTATLSWSSATTWQGGSDTSSGDAQMLRAYLDDGTSDGALPQGATINVDDLEFLSYKVYIYTNTDTENVQFTAKSVNGTSYTYKDGATVEGSAGWGDSDERGTPKLGTNALCVIGLSDANLQISGGAKTNSSRGCISGIQIVDTYAGTKYSGTLAGNATWSQVLEGWTNSSAAKGTYASLAVSAEGGAATLTLDGDKTTDAVMLSSGNLTISGEHTLNLIGASRLQAAAGTTLTIGSSTTLAGDAHVAGSGIVSVSGLSDLSSVTVNRGGHSED